MYILKEYKDYDYLMMNKPTYQTTAYSAKRLKEKLKQRLKPNEDIELENPWKLKNLRLFSITTRLKSNDTDRYWRFVEVDDPLEGKYSSLDICTFLRENKIPLTQLGTLCYFIQAYYASHGIRLMKDDFINSYTMGMITDEIDTQIYCAIGWNISWATDVELDDVDKEIILALISEMKDKNIEMVYELPKELNKKHISYYDMRRYYKTPVRIEDFFNKIILNK